MLKFWLFCTICATFLHDSKQLCGIDFQDYVAPLSKTVLNVPLEIARVMVVNNSILECQYMYANNGTRIHDDANIPEDFRKAKEPKFAYFSPFTLCQQPDRTEPDNAYWKLIPTTAVSEKNVFEIENVDSKQILLVRDFEVIIPEDYASESNRYVFTENRNKTAMSTDSGALWQICSEDDTHFYIKNFD